MGAKLESSMEMKMASLKNLQIAIPSTSLSNTRARHDVMSSIVHPCPTATGDIIGGLGITSKILLSRPGGLYWLTDEDEPIALVGAEIKHRSGYTQSTGLVLAPLIQQAKAEAGNKYDTPQLPDGSQRRTRFIPMQQSVKDLCIIKDSDSAVVAFGGSVGVLALKNGEEDNEGEDGFRGDNQGGGPSVLYTGMNGDIREMAITENLVSFGGFNRFVTVCSLSEGREETSVLWKTQAGGVVSSVRWHPQMPNVVSWTTDRGELRGQDTRLPSSFSTSGLAYSDHDSDKGDSLFYWPGRNGTYTHGYCGLHGLLVGGTGGVFNILDQRKITVDGSRKRSSSIIATITDPLLSDIGDIQIVNGYGGPTLPSSNVIMTGRGGFTCWNMNIGDGCAIHQLKAVHAIAPKRHMMCEGRMVTSQFGEPLFCCTDNMLGQVQLYSI
eukprot:473392_1